MTLSSFDPRDLNIQNKKERKRKTCLVKSFPSIRLRAYIYLLIDFLAFAMQQFQTYLLSSNYKPDLVHVVDDNRNNKYLSDDISRLKSNDSGISYDDSDDSESIFSNEYDFDVIDPPTITITHDGIKIPFFHKTKRKLI